MRGLFDGDSKTFVEGLDFLGEGEGVMGGGDGETLRREKVGFPFLLTPETYCISFTLFFSMTLDLIMGATFAEG